MFASLLRVLPPQVRACYLLSIATHLMIIHYLCYVYFSPLQFNDKPCDGILNMHLFLDLIPWLRTWISQWIQEWTRKHSKSESVVYRGFDTCTKAERTISWKCTLKETRRCTRIECGKSCTFLIQNAHVPCTSLSSPWYEQSWQKRAKLEISQLETNFPVGRKDVAPTTFFSISIKQIIKHLEQPKRALETRDTV